MGRKESNQSINQLRSERETSDGVGMYLKIHQRMSYFVFGVNIFFVGGGGVKTKFSCEVYHRL